jgi:hypothetical protein
VIFLNLEKFVEKVASLFSFVIASTNTTIIGDDANDGITASCSTDCNIKCEFVDLYFLSPYLEKKNRHYFPLSFVIASTNTDDNAIIIADDVANNDSLECKFVKLIFSLRIWKKKRHNIILLFLPL